MLIRGRMRSSEWVAYVAPQLVAAGRVRVHVRARARVRCPECRHRARNRGDSFYGLAIGFTVAAGAFAVGGVSGGAFNPAVALGASVLGIFKWSHYWIYVVGPLLGAVIAAGAFLYTQPAEKPEGDVEAART